MQHSLLDLLRPSLVPELGSDIAAGTSRHVQLVLIPVAAVRERHPEKNVWCYSGYLFDRELLSESRARCGYTDEMLSMIDILVDGRFVEKLKDIRLVFRGSSNQRLIDVKKSLETGDIVLWEPKVKRGID